MDSDDDEGVSMAKPLSVVMNAILMKKAVTRTPPPPPVMVKPGIRYPILNPTDKEGFFAVASLILHADLDPESGVIETRQCPQGLHLIGKNNLGCTNYISGKFMEMMGCIMCNQIGALDMIDEIGKLNKVEIESFLEKTNKVFNEACQSQPCVELTKTKELFSGRCVEMMQHIDDLTQAAQQECVAGGDTATNLASVIELNDRCIRLNGSLHCSFDNLFKSTSPHYVSDFVTGNFVRYGVKDRYLCDKTYSLKFPPLHEKIVTPLDRFIHDDLMGHLHLAVGLRLGGAVYTVQANVNLKELKQTTHFNHNKVTLHEIVTVLMNQHMRKRVVDLMCEEHSTLNNKEVKKNLGEMAKTNWDVALVDFGCTNIHGPSTECPHIVHMPTPNHNPTEERQVVMGVVNTPARLALGKTYIMKKPSGDELSAQPPEYKKRNFLKVSQGAAAYLPNTMPVYSSIQASELLTSVEEVPAPAPPSPPPKSLTDPPNFDPNERRTLKRTFSTLAQSDNTPRATLSSSDSEGGKRPRQPRQPRQPTRQPRRTTRQPRRTTRQPRRTTRRRSMRTRTKLNEKIEHKIK
jgi:hypothetical protein